MKVGDLVRDKSTNETVLIVRVKPEYSDAFSSERLVWDFEVLNDGLLYNVDVYYLESIDDSNP